jgi:glutathionylspermidine synthase
VVRNRRYEPFRLSPEAVTLVEESWRRREPALYGRFDLAYDGTGAPKLLEYNADTPTALFEAAVIQWQWLESRFPDADQFNSIHEGLVERWQWIAGGFHRDEGLHLTCLTPHAEDEGTVRYLMATALEAGLGCKFISLADIGWDGRRFVDMEAEPITRLFKLYPWEWLLTDAYGANILPSGIHMIEPGWKMLLSNKAILSLLWHLHPNHPNLLPASFERGDIPGQAVRKPLLGREGANVALLNGDAVLCQEDGPYADSGWIYQQYAPLRREGDIHTVVGAWMIGDKCRGMGLREDDGPITRNTSRFVPHLFR